MTVRKGVRKCILHYFKLLLLVPFLIGVLYLKKKLFSSYSLLWRVSFYNSSGAKEMREGGTGGFRNC